MEWLPPAIILPFDSLCGAPPSAHRKWQNLRVNRRLEGKPPYGKCNLQLWIIVLLTKVDKRTTKNLPPATAAHMSSKSKKDFLLFCAHFLQNPLSAVEGRKEIYRRRLACSVFRCIVVLKNDRGNLKNIPSQRAAHPFPNAILPGKEICGGNAGLYGKFPLRIVDGIKGSGKQQFLRARFYHGVKIRISAVLTLW